jgi:DnaK suppressor protein
MNDQLVQDNKIKLLDEQKRLWGMLNKDSKPDSDSPSGRKPNFTEAGNEEGENASESEQFGNELSVMGDLQSRLGMVEAALKRIDDGTYGKCKFGDEIEEARLKAEPAADTCIKHAK